MSTQRKTPHLKGASKQRGWTTSELNHMRDGGRRGAEIIAAELGRSVSSVKAAAVRYRISLRRKGSRRGLSLGLPRGAKRDELPPELKEMHELSLERPLAAARMHELAKIDGKKRPPTCPACGKNPQRRVTGLCDACHLDLLREKRGEVEAALMANAAYDKQVQSTYRLGKELQG